jgi:Dienelactone hydrolase family
VARVDMRQRSSSRFSSRKHRGPTPSESLELSLRRSVLEVCERKNNSDFITGCATSLGNMDDWCTPAKVNDLEAALKHSKSEFELYRYDAHHVFMNEARPEVYDSACAKTAWERTLTFLKKALT